MSFEIKTEWMGVRRLSACAFDFFFLGRIFFCQCEPGNRFSPNSTGLGDVYTTEPCVKERVLLI